MIEEALHRLKPLPDILPTGAGWRIYTKGAYRTMTSSFVSPQQNRLRRAYSLFATACWLSNLVHTGLSSYPFALLGYLLREILTECFFAPAGQLPLARTYI